MKPHIHIVCFDIPYPADYGGAIDAYYRLKFLSAAGVDITLHCTYKGELKHYPELESLCREVYYYRRRTNILANLSILPYTVIGRKNDKLLHNLLSDNDPILFEGLVTCYYLNHPALAARKRYMRECNVEHDYYRSLAKATRNPLHKLYFYIESYKLKRFERVLAASDGIISLAHQDEQHFLLTYPNTHCCYVPCFHANEKITAMVGSGNYILYHANMRVAENELAALHIVRCIASQMPTVQFVIAGKQPSDLIREEVHKLSNVTLIENPTDRRMQDLVRNAQIHLLLTFQATGLKLKLLNVLYGGRFVIVNPEMVCGTELSDIVTGVGSTDDELITLCKQYMSRQFTAEDIALREQLLSHNFSPAYLTEQLLAFLRLS